MWLSWRRDPLREFGVAVDDDPTVTLATTARWGARAEPDLAATLADEPWPVEVQRGEVSPRTLHKWSKTLELAGRLALILLSAEAAKKQARILRGNLPTLPTGTICVISLEALEAGNWDWPEVAVPERDDDRL